MSMVVDRLGVFDLDGEPSAVPFYNRCVFSLFGCCHTCAVVRGFVFIMDGWVAPTTVPSTKSLMRMRL
jgi:hypothetical protein